MQSIPELFRGITTWKSGDRRAPNKPLLLLLSLAKVQNGEGRLFYFSDIKDELKQALTLFGPTRSSPAAHYPFWRLQNDGVWDFHADGELTIRQSNTDPTSKSLIECNAKAGFMQDIYKELSQKPNLISESAHVILDNHFPTSIHDDLLTYFGLNLSKIADQNTSKPFGQEIVSLYKGRCAVTGRQILINGLSSAVTATYIKWPNAGGESFVRNGLCLESTISKLFYLGAFTIGDDLSVQVSAMLKGSPNVKSRHGKRLFLPDNKDLCPSAENIHWHNAEVFRG